MKTISELANYYRTDKMKNENCHNYAEIYDHVFEPVKDKVVDLMEIGILNHPNKTFCPYEGASILMWGEYFDKATIHGMDINDHTQMNTYGNDRIKIYICDQGDRMRLKHLMESKIGREMDIIIDDGSHFMHHQQISLGFLFKYVKSGGIYVVEDLFSSHTKPPFLAMDFKLSPDDTRTEDMLFEFKKTGKINSMFMKPDEIKYLEENIKECIIEQGAPPISSRIAFLVKK